MGKTHITYSNERKNQDKQTHTQRTSAFLCALCVCVYTHLFGKGKPQMKDLINKCVRDFFFLISKEPEFSWRGGKKTDAQL